MRKYFFLILIAFASFTANAQNKSEKQPYLTKSFSGENISSVISETSGGNISVTGVASSESKVEVFVNQNNSWKKTLSNDELKARVNEDYDLDVSVSNGKLTATATPKYKITDWKKSLSFSFRIYATANISTKLQTSGGNISLSKISGNQDFTTSGGNLSLNAVTGKVKGRTSGGNIYFKDCKDDLDLSTSGGNIQAENSSGDIRIATSGGSIQLSGLAGTIDAKTSGGNIGGESIEGELAASTSGGNVSLQQLNCSVKASTSGGNIDVAIANPGKYVSIHNSAGKVRLTLPKNKGMDLKLNAMKISTQNLENFNGTNNKDEINGTVNGGGIPVIVDAGSGKIDVVFD